MVEMRQRRKPLVLASTQALLDSLPGDRPPPPPQEPVRLKAGVLRFPSGGGGTEFGELASFVGIPAPALRRLAVVTGTPVSPLVSVICFELESRAGKFDRLGFVAGTLLGAFRKSFGRSVELEGCTGLSFTTRL
jgi:hypothetical protein